MLYRTDPIPYCRNNSTVSVRVVLRYKCRSLTVTRGRLTTSTGLCIKERNCAWVTLRSDAGCTRRYEAARACTPKSLNVMPLRSLLSGRSSEFDFPRPLYRLCLQVFDSRNRSVHAVLLLSKTEFLPTDPLYCNITVTNRSVPLAALFSYAYPSLAGKSR